MHPIIKRALLFENNIMMDKDSHLTYSFITIHNCHMLLTV